MSEESERFVLADSKLEQWNRFSLQVEHLRRRGRAGLRALDRGALSELLDSYQALIADLARAR
ncbi:MAG: hypothetical protein AB1758_32955, partial [Candidatus Eremiobacterota bacterium]